MVRLLGSRVLLANLAAPVRGHREPRRHVGNVALYNLYFLAGLDQLDAITDLFRSSL